MAYYQFDFDFSIGGIKTICYLKSEFHISLEKAVLSLNSLHADCNICKGSYAYNLTIWLQSGTKYCSMIFNDF